jgi:hypothetical protein
MKTHVALTLLLFLLSFTGFSQNLTQTIRGTVTDKDTKAPMEGALIRIEGSELGGISDEAGKFRIAAVPVGRINLSVTYIGYEPYVAQQITLNSGKELVLNLELTESAITTDEVLITAGDSPEKALNEMASVSVRSFSVEETKRYAASAFDPGRMALSFAGVSGGGDDLTNEIVVRGNSPRGVLWRLEGIEIPNPNHFGAMGNSGGGVSMLSSSTLANSDFYTGAFPAEFGNALSGAFDLNFRNGNNEKREYSLMIGALGVEASAEGPFSQNSRASYLVNYRYSTFDLLGRLGLSPVGDLLPRYQDLSFKLNLPAGKAGVFSIFGLGGINDVTETAEADSGKWAGWWDGVNYTEKQWMGVAGISHRLLLSEKTYLKTVVSAGTDNYRDEYFKLDPEKGYEGDLFDKTHFDTQTLRASMMLNHKANARNTFRTGAIYTRYFFKYRYDNKDIDENIWTNYVASEGNSGLFQAYFQWKHRFDDRWTLNTGAHFTRFDLNGNYSIEPRTSIRFQINPRQSISAAAGLHSKLEPIGLYFSEEKEPSRPSSYPNKDLELGKSFHAVLGYDWNFAPDFRLKVEAYYQHLYDVAIATDTASIFSTLNMTDIWDLDSDGLASKGTGRNIGIDLTLEKFFSRNYYFLLTGSLYDSRFTAASGKTYNSRFNGRYSTTLLGGKEFRMGKKKANTLGINGKLILNGGNRYTAIDLESSIAEGHQVQDNRNPFGEQAPAYFRVDLGIHYKINKRRTTHTIMLDLQNVSNRQNLYTRYYDNETKAIENWYQTGIFPLFNYRVEF